jgi:hypothetical protein
MLRTDALARLLLERLMSLGPMTELAAIEAVEWREPGRGASQRRSRGPRARA